MALKDLVNSAPPARSTLWKQLVDPGCGRTTARPATDSGDGGSAVFSARLMSKKGTIDGNDHEIKSEAGNPLIWFGY